MYEADKGLEAAVFFGVLVVGLVLNILFSLAVRRLVADGTIGRLGSTIVQCVALAPLCVAPLLLAEAAKSVAARFGKAIFIVDDGSLIVVALLGIALPFATPMILGVVRVIRGETADPSPPRTRGPAPRPSTGARDMFSDFPPSAPPQVAGRSGSFHREGRR